MSKLNELFRLVEKYPEGLVFVLENDPKFMELAKDAFKNPEDEDSYNYLFQYVQDKYNSDNEYSEDEIGVAVDQATNDLELPDKSYDEDKNEDGEGPGLNALGVVPMGPLRKKVKVKYNGRYAKFSEEKELESLNKLLEEKNKFFDNVYAVKMVVNGKEVDPEIEDYIDQNDGQIQIYPDDSRYEEGFMIVSFPSKSVANKMADLFKNMKDDVRDVEIIKYKEDTQYSGR